MLSEIEQMRVQDAKATDRAEAAGRGILAKDRATARRWLRRHGYEHLIPGYVETAS